MLVLPGSFTVQPGGKIANFPPRVAVEIGSREV
jgi:hypothetical protein